MSKRKIVRTFYLIVVLILLGFIVYFYRQVNLLKNNNSNSISKNNISEIVSKVSKLYLIPTNEEPTIATVSDPEILKDQSFFTQSEKGDKVLIFTRAGKAVLYRPSIDKIIETAPIKNNQLNSTNQNATESKAISN